jgi:Cu2+-containing amine oxidase
MHALGRKMAVQIERGDDIECAADVDRYDYNWQRTYFYDGKINVDAGDTMRVQCDFDTRAAEGPVSAGFGTQDEMCLVGLFFTEAE